MTHTYLPPPKLPRPQRWSLWSRIPRHPGHWYLETLGTLPECEGVAQRLHRETLILPPGETPVMRRESCDPGERP